MVTVLLNALTGEAAGGGNPMLTALERPSLVGILWFTTWQAVASTALTLALGLPAAYVFARYQFPGRRTLLAATVVPFVLPTVVTGTAFLALLGPGGPLGVDLRRSVPAILLAHVFANYAVVVRTVATAWEQLDRRVEEAAQTLGANRLRTLIGVTLPLLAPAIASAASIVFLFTFTSFGIILILGGIGLATLEVEIWRQATALLDLGVAAALAVIQLVGVTIALVLYGRTQRRRAVQLVAAPADQRHRPRGRAWLLVGGNLAVAAALIGLPVGMLVVRSVQGSGGWGLTNYAGLATRATDSGLFVAPIEAIANSLRFALVATLIAVMVGMVAAVVVASRSPVARGLDTLVMLPLGTSAVTLGFGFLIALDAPIDLRTSPWLIPIAHALVAVPFVVRSALPVLRRIQQRLRDAAATLGASPRRVFLEVDGPLVGRAVAVGAGFAFAVSLGEFGATSFIARPDAPTLPIAIYRLISRPGEVLFGRAMALAVILMVLTTVAAMAIERLRPGGGGEF
ncbi:MAG: iron ABC transporter permease [Acidimicrobiia bacterium]|nr:iron ABC transporter permease [Acidimicrobiia bacterium]